MIDQILKHYRKSKFDFRKYTNPNDPIKGVFAVCVPYYRLKHSISAILQPRTILEIGVRFGYSMFSFLDAAPESNYLGIDIDSEQFGGTKGSIYWAKEKARDFRAEFIIANTQEMTQLPGNDYDLIHVDGQQDGVGTYHDLYLAIHQARYILLDGFFWSEENFTCSCQFLIDHKDKIEYFWSIPGYAGELLIRVAEPFRKLSQQARRLEQGRAGADQQQNYNALCYLDNCSGSDAFNRTGGRILEDEWLKAMFSLASPTRGQRFLDLGCGRGELAYQAARKGAEVLAVGYSEEIVQVGRQVFTDEPELQKHVEFRCSDFASLKLNAQYDRVVAANLVEHLNPEDLQKLLSLVAQHLASGGRFIIHTTPNLWYYRWGYDKHRREVMKQNHYLPIEPRSVYEKLMHINEQTPTRLKRALRAHFQHVKVWLCRDEDDYRGSLARKYSIDDCRMSGEIMAVAAQEPIDPDELLPLLEQQPLPPSAMAAEIVLNDAFPREMKAGWQCRIPVRLVNQGEKVFNSQAPAPIYLCYHWIDPDHAERDIHDGCRTHLPFPILPKEDVALEMDVIAPDIAGDYQLQLTLVQETVAWFEHHNPLLPIKKSVKVKSV